MATEVSSQNGLAQFQSVQKAMALPTVGAAVGQVGALYSKLKGAHMLLDWALSTAETHVTNAATVAAPFIAAPLAAGDAKVAAALDEFERRVPLIAEQPKVIVETTKNAMLTRLTPQIDKAKAVTVAAEQRVKSLKELSWTQANKLLTTTYGQKAVHTVDTSANFVMELLDIYLPNIGPQEEAKTDIVPANSDPVLHTVQTVGRLSVVAARRVWANLAYKINELRQNGVELDPRRYVTALLAALHLAKVTSEQQKEEREKEEKEKQKEEKQQEKQSPTEPAPVAPSPPQKVETSISTTTKKVKTTPEGKSKAKPEKNHQQQ